VESHRFDDWLDESLQSVETIFDSPDVSRMGYTIISPASSERFADVQFVKKGNPRVSKPRCCLIPFVAL
jgi:hypothetical protein